jgi:hypothetical protein
VYDEEDWLPSKEASSDHAEGVDSDVAVHRVSKSVLKDLGNKCSGDEMDLIAKTAEHGYYLRSLEHAQSYPSGGGAGPSGSADAGHAVPDEGDRIKTVITVCPYNIPEPRLPAPPTPRGNAANDYYEALEARDQEIRKGELTYLVASFMQHY